MADTEPDCPFCGIAAGRAEAHRVHDTDDVVAFLDRNPAVEGHTLVAPKPHVEDIVLAEPELRGSTFRAVRTVAEALDAVVGVDAHTVVHTSGSLVGTVEHAHVHLLPRSPDDGVSMTLSRRELDPERGAALADRIREAA
ncbi:HIT family protein [Halobacteriales archaeon QH_7_69_31]|nr:MAG: HIT family protein [Halobacteriales archaeon QH_7_69_31]